MNRHQYGMSFLELIISLCLLALLIGVGVPSMSEFVSNQRITAATNQMITHLQHARTSAVTRNQHVIACPSTDQINCSGNRWDTGWIVFADPDDNRQVDQVDDILRVVSSDAHIRVTSGGRLRVRFQPNGSAYGSNLTLRVCPRNAAVEGRAVIVSNPGRVRMQKRLSRPECND